MGKITPEGLIKQAIMTYLNLLGPKVYARTIQVGMIPNGNGGFRKNHSAGMSDIIACVNGKYVALEVKAKKGVVSDLQAQFLFGVVKSGGVAAVVHSLEEAQAVIEPLL